MTEKWPGPGTSAHSYWPDLMAMGDCLVCGHTAEAHAPAAPLPPQHGRQVDLAFDWKSRMAGPGFDLDAEAGR